MPNIIGSAAKPVLVQTIDTWRDGTGQNGIDILLEGDQVQVVILHEGQRGALLIDPSLPWRDVVNLPAEHVERLGEGLLKAAARLKVKLV